MVLVHDFKNHETKLPKVSANQNSWTLTSPAGGPGFSLPTGCRDAVCLGETAHLKWEREQLTAQPGDGVTTRPPTHCSSLSISRALMVFQQLFSQCPQRLGQAPKPAKMSPRPTTRQALCHISKSFLQCDEHCDRTCLGTQWGHGKVCPERSCLRGTR